MSVRVRRQRLRRFAAVTTLAGSMVVVPWTGAASAGSADLDYRRAPWLDAPGIVVDPPAPAIGETAPPSVGRGYVVTGEDLPRFDITSTAAAQRVLAEFLARIAASEGTSVPRDGFQVFTMPKIDDAISGGPVVDDPAHALPVGTDAVAPLIEDEGGTGSFVILPAGTTVSYVGAAWDEGVLKVTTVLETTPAAAALTGTLTEDGPGDSRSWSPAGGLGCTSRKQNDTAWFDTCSWWYELYDDGNRDRQTWALEQYGTGRSKGCCKLKSLHVTSWRAKGSADQDWVRWSPTADTTLPNCSTDTVGVTVNNAYLEHSTTHCEQWDIDKAEEPAGFDNAWRGSVGGSERNTAMLIATNTPNSYVPTDYVSFDYYAW